MGHSKKTYAQDYGQSMVDAPVHSNNVIPTDKNRLCYRGLMLYHEPEGGKEGSNTPTKPPKIPDKSVGDVQAKLMAKLVPSSLVPISTANGMLILGSHKREEDCFVPLPRTLIWTGTVSIAIVIAGVVGRYILKWVMTDKTIHRGEYCIVKFLAAFGYVLVVVEIATLCILTGMVYPLYPNWQYEYPQLPDYCDYGIVLFLVVYLLMAWFFFIFGLACAAYIVFVANRRKKPEAYYSTGDYFLENPSKEFVKGIVENA